MAKQNDDQLRGEDEETDTHPLSGIQHPFPTDEQEEQPAKPADAAAEPAPAEEPTEAAEPEKPDETTAQAAPEPAETNTLSPKDAAQEPAPSTPSSPAPTPEAAKPVAEPPKPPEPNPIVKELSEVNARIESDDFDPYSKEGRQDLAKLARLEADLQFHRYQEAQEVFSQAADRSGKTISEVRQTWQDCYKKAAGKWGDGEVARAVATEAFEAATATKAKSEPTPTPTPKAAPTQVRRAPATAIPRGVTPSRPPPPKQLDEQEEFVSRHRGNGVASLIND